MKLNEIEDADKLVTKEYLETVLSAKLNKLELSISDCIIASERGQRMWLWGLYALVIVSYFVRH
jgi:hypothetical protein